VLQKSLRILLFCNVKLYINDKENLKNGIRWVFLGIKTGGRNMLALNICIGLFFKPMLVGLIGRMHYKALIKYE
jgi:hypothetical protein